MRIAHFYCMGRHMWGVPSDDGIVVHNGSPFDSSFGATDHTLVWETAHLRPPAAPSKIVCIGSNYRRHCEEMGRPIPGVPKLFMKPPSALLAHEQSIELPADVGRVDFEGELALVIGRRARKIREDQAAEHVLGYTILNDVTARELQKQDTVFTRAKGFDTFCPLGPWLETDLDPRNLALSTRVNGEVRQDSSTSDMIFDPFRLVSFISHIMTLEPGDVISTGTPSGVGPLAAGDVVEVSIEGIGTLSNGVTAV